VYSLSSSRQLFPFYGCMRQRLSVAAARSAIFPSSSTADISFFRYVQAYFHFLGVHVDWHL
jgi:hypothetical protein